MSTIPISLPEHRIQLPLQALGDTPISLDPNSMELTRYRVQAQKIFDQGGRFTMDDLSAIVAQAFLRT